MSLLSLPIPTVAEIRQRIDERTHLLSQASDEEFARLSFIFAQAEYLGRLLHATRECLEATVLQDEPIIHPAAPDNTTLSLWESGWALPEEVEAGLVTALVRWYIDHMRAQRQETAERRLARDMMSIFSELHGEDPLPLAADIAAWYGSLPSESDGERPHEH